MNKTLIYLLCLNVCAVFSASASGIINPGFEDGWNGWGKVDKTGKSLGISKDSNSGEKSAKITKKTGYFAQNVAVDAHKNYQLSVYVRGPGVLAVKVAGEVLFERQKKKEAKNKKWNKLSLNFNSKEANLVTIFAQFNGKKGQFDDFSLTSLDDNATVKSAGIHLGYKGLSPDRAPGENFDLIDWNVNLPFDKNGDGKSDNISVKDLAKGYQHKEFFYTAADGGMVFKAPNVAPRTSKNTKYTRSELREMLRRGDTSIKVKGEGGTTSKNNWVFSSAPKWAQDRSGGVDGTLSATLAVNHVSTTGDPKKIGRVIIGQIHAKDDEPIRIYYHKLPHNKKGAIYTAHEPLGEKDQWQMILGDSRSSKMADPKEGIALDEKFSYEIITKGYELTVIISQEGKELGRAEYDMSESNYDKKDDYMYFKAGVYNQNNSGEEGDYVQATFYELHNTHQGYQH